MTSQVVDPLSETARLAKKRRGLGRNPRAWLRMAAVAPALAIFRLAGAKGFEIAIYPDHFGHQALDVEHHLRTAGNRRSRCLYFASDVIPNAFLFQKHRTMVRIIRLPRGLMRYLRIAEKTSIRAFGRALFYTRGLEEKMVDSRTWNGVPPQIVFTAEDHRRGETMLARLGLERGRYVCLHSRDHTYGLSHHTKMVMGRGSARSANKAAAHRLVAKSEESLLQRYRNSDFVAYEKALAVLERRGLRGVRLGAKVDRDYNDLLPNLVDFAGRYRDGLGPDADFSDLYLMAHCCFYIGTSSGVTGFSYIFNRPIVWVNSFPWPWAHVPPIAGSIYLPKLMRRGDGATLMFAEMVELSRRWDWRAMYDDAFFAREDVAAVDNTPDEIAESITEMCDWLEGHWQPDPADQVRQDALAGLFDRSLPIHRTRARMGRAFLASHSDLLPAGAS